ncbi:hypothetical protein [Loigolactobacillus coryniformis]|uniref:hypothetical protein n=1 Tax=Loigolactobacillus coryniformis TaxID=1610 RepID=UPI00345D7838
MENQEKIYFNSHFNVDGKEYLNVILNHDISKYLDPNRFKYVPTKYFDSQAALNVISQFLKTVYSFYEQGKDYLAYPLLTVPKEMNATRLGLSADRPQGTGTSKDILNDLMRTVHRMNISPERLNRSPQVLLLFVPNFGPDRFSDFMTNLIAKQLCDFTKKVCLVHGIVDFDKFSISYFNVETRDWDTYDAQLPYDAGGRPIILCPKEAVVDEYNFSPTRYIQRVILAAKQAELIAQDSPRVKHKFSKQKNQMIPVPPTKKELYNTEVKPLGKNGPKKYALRESLKQPKLFADYLGTTETTA